MNTKTINQQQINFYHDIIESIVAALEAKDLNTADHSRRVGDMAHKLSQCLRLPETECEMIHMAAHVHDIGKIGVPDYILIKPDKLLPHEWEFIKKHPQIGANILNKAPNLSDISLMVLHHHERWDGKGYPSGLKGEDIPLGSRIIAVCDSIDAMKSPRAYRVPISDRQCKAEIKKNSSKMYDPEIVQCVLKHWRLLINGY
jgi:HD-GYP domain-containing protein (c-di-GMP phosphodiesterase class II)